MATTAYATSSDVESLWRPLTASEATRVNQLLTVVSDLLRQEAKNRGKDLDEMIAKGAVLFSVVKSVTVDVVARTLMTPTNGAPMTQYSESALGYSVSGTFLSPGGGIFIKRDELARLGLRKQRIGVIDLVGGADPARCDDNSL